MKGITKLTSRDCETCWEKYKDFVMRVWCYFKSDFLADNNFVLCCQSARGIFQLVVVENSFLHILIKFSKLLRNKNERLKASRQLAMVAFTPSIQLCTLISSHISIKSVFFFGHFTHFAHFTQIYPSETIKWSTFNWNSTQLNKMLSRI